MLSACIVGFRLLTLQIPDYHYEKKNSQNKHIIAHVEYVFIFHYSHQTVSLAENLDELKITHYEKVFSHIKQIFSHFEKGFGNMVTKKTFSFFVSLRLPLFSPRYIALKLSQK